MKAHGRLHRGVLALLFVIVTIAPSTSAQATVVQHVSDSQTNAATTSESAVNHTDSDETSGNTSDTSNVIPSNYGHWGNVAWNFYKGNKVMDVATYNDTNVGENPGKFLRRDPRDFEALRLTKTIRIRHDIWIDDPSYLREMFKGAENLTTIEGLQHLKTIKRMKSDAIIWLNSMFEGTNIQNIDCSQLDFGGRRIITDDMFRGAKSVDLSKLNFPFDHVIEAHDMFSDMKQLQKISLTHEGKETVAPGLTAIDRMFDGDEALQSIEWKLRGPNIRSAKSLFNNCKSLTAVNLDALQSEKLELVTAMFANCRSLRSVSLQNFLPHINIYKLQDSKDFLYKAPVEDFIVPHQFLNQLYDVSNKNRYYAFPFERNADDEWEWIEQNAIEPEQKQQTLEEWLLDDDYDDTDLMMLHRIADE
ncbi:hypothetical protein D2E26_0188 [Bifidobacterium dolichotidis]|uniref:Lipoprotein n=1 Tax=Bifidobacterium dolichotidis TaxID=2306976 RepID=A0A430FRZ5_9BIFI|nr:BspA family leucine-rich repeat surface protein [Bifidobacterium dolichotidis]RSX55625.1 hypothetical protein D2E26_0188 [Bifidobacterium dolichotidis]